MKLRKFVACILTALARRSCRLRAGPDRPAGGPDPAGAPEGHIHPWRCRTDEGPVDPAMPIRQATLLFKPAASLDAFLVRPAGSRISQLTTSGSRRKNSATASALATPISRRLPPGWNRARSEGGTRWPGGRHWMTFSAPPAGQPHLHARFRRYRSERRDPLCQCRRALRSAALAGVWVASSASTISSCGRNIAGPQYSPPRIPQPDPDDLPAIL